MERKRVNVFIINTVLSVSRHTDCFLAWVMSRLQLDELNISVYFFVVLYKLLLILVEFNNCITLHDKNEEIKEIETDCIQIYNHFLVQLPKIFIYEFGSNQIPVAVLHPPIASIVSLHKINPANITIIWHYHNNEWFQIINTCIHIQVLQNVQFCKCSVNNMMYTF